MKYFLDKHYLKQSYIEAPHSPQALFDHPPLSAEQKVNVTIRQIQDLIYESIVQVGFQAWYVKNITAPAVENESVSTPEAGETPPEIEKKIICFSGSFKYAGLVRVDSTPEESDPDAVNQFMMTIIPYQLYPHIKQAVAQLTAQAGFSPFFISDVNFDESYQKQQQAEELTKLDP